jgi:hypothetical protein
VQVGGRALVLDRPREWRVRLAAYSLDVTPLVSQVVDLDDAPGALDRLERGESVKILARIPRPTKGERS